MNNARAGSVRNRTVVVVALLAAITLQGAAYATPSSFGAAKAAMRESVYHDQSQNGALGFLFCGCDWRWVGRSGGRVDHASCGYETRAQEN